MYNTGNPIGSTAPKDFSDNSEITDRYVNDVVNETTLDRFGRSRLTIHGQQEKARRSFEQFESDADALLLEKKNEADNVIANLGFFPPVDYTTGLSVDSRNFTVTYNDVVYAAQPSAVPFTTGAWDDAQWYPIQNVLNQKNLLVFDTYAEASAAATTLPDGQEIESTNSDWRLSRFVVQSGALVFKDYAQDVINLHSYDDLRTYQGKSASVNLTSRNIAGLFVRDDYDVDSPDNGVTIVVDSTNRRYKRQFSGVIYATWGGGAYDGITDDTESLRKVHSVANALGLPVSYVGIEKYAIQANADITVTTPIDFANAEPVFLGGSDSTEKTTYRVTSNKPIESLTGISLSGDLTAGSITPFGNLFAGRSGCAALEVPGLLQLDRARTGTDSFYHTFYVNEKGQCTSSNVVDLTAYNSGMNVRFLEDSGGWIDFSNIRINVDDGVQRLNFLRISRNFCRVGGVIVHDKTTVAQAEFHSLIRVADCAFIDVSDLVGPAIGSGSETQYLVHTVRTSDITFRNVKAANGGWGFSSLNKTTNVVYEDCDVNRVDAHDGVINLTVNGGSVSGLTGAVQYGWGGGKLYINGTKFNATTDLVKTRTDYSGNWYGGGIEINDASFTPGSANSAVINLRTDATSEAKGVMPEYLRINGLDVKPKNTTWTTSLLTMRHRTDGLEGDITAPLDIQICGVTGNGKLNFQPTLEEFVPHASGFTRIKLRDIGQEVAINTPAPFYTRTAEFAAEVSVDNCSVVAGVVRSYLAKYSIINSQVKGNPRFWRNTTRAMMANCEVNYVDAVNPFFSGTAPTLLSGGQVSLRDVYFTSNCDISGMTSMQGVTFKPGITATLPSGATVSTAFTGWKAGTILQ